MLPSPSRGEGTGVRGFSIEFTPVENLTKCMALDRQIQIPIGVNSIIDPLTPNPSPFYE